MQYARSSAVQTMAVLRQVTYIAHQAQWGVIKKQKKNKIKISNAPASQPFWLFGVFYVLPIFVGTW